MKPYKLAIATLVAAILCGGSTFAAEPLKIGVISSRSGVFAIFGISGERGALLAQEEINAAGGVLGRQIEITATDSKSKPEEASRLFRELVAQGAVVVLGTIASGETQAVSTLALEHKVPFFTGLGYSRFLTEEAGHRYFFRLISNSRAYYGPMVDRLLKEGKKRYCTINNDFAFGRDLNESVMGDLKKGNPQVEVIAGCEFWVPLGTTDFSTYLTAILSKRPEIVMFGGLVGPSGRAFVAQANQFGLFQRVIGAHPAMGWPANAVGLREQDIPKRTIITGGDYPYPLPKAEASQRFYAAYKKRWNEEPVSEGAHAYATIMFMKKAFEKAGKVDREAFIEAAKGLSVVHPSLGEITVRPFDNQSNAGVWVGYLSWSKEHNRPGMEDVTYIPGDKYLPSEAEVTKLRKK
jgi:branched-chain amino acid transport system substrate-binding protein